MILHISHHKEGRNFNVNPITGTYTDCHLFLEIKSLKYTSSVYFEGFNFIVDTRHNKEKLTEQVNKVFNTVVFHYDKDAGELWLRDKFFPEVRVGLNSYITPQVRKNRPERLVEILQFL